MSPAARVTTVSRVHTARLVIHDLKPQKHRTRRHRPVQDRVGRDGCFIDEDRRLGIGADGHQAVPRPITRLRWSASARRCSRVRCSGAARRVSAMTAGAAGDSAVGPGATGAGSTVVGGVGAASAEAVSKTREAASRRRRSASERSEPLALPRQIIRASSVSAVPAPRAPRTTDRRGAPIRGTGRRWSPESSGDSRSGAAPVSPGRWHGHRPPVGTRERIGRRTESDRRDAWPGRAREPCPRPAQVRARGREWRQRGVTMLGAERRRVGAAEGRRSGQRFPGDGREGVLVGRGAHPGEARKADRLGVFRPLGRGIQLGGRYPGDAAAPGRWPWSSAHTTPKSRTRADPVASRTMASGVSRRARSRSRGRRRGPRRPDSPARRRARAAVVRRAQ